MNTITPYKEYLHIIFSSPNNTFIPLSFRDGVRWCAATAIKIYVDDDGIITYKLVRYRKMNDSSKHEIYTSDLRLLKRTNKHYDLKGYTLIDDVSIKLSFKITEHGCIRVKWQRKGYASSTLYVLDKDISRLLNV